MVKNISEYGKTIQKRLIEIGKNQNWLIKEVSAKTGLFFDSSYMHKILTGTERSPKIVSAINEILEI